MKKESYLDKFLLDCDNKGMTTHSIETYKSNLIEFLKYNPSPLDVGTDHLLFYLQNLKARNLSHSTLKGYFAAVSSFYDFLVFFKFIPINPVTGFRKRYILRGKDHPATRQIIGIEDMRQLLSIADHVVKRLIILMPAKTGIRNGEFHDLKVSDLDFEHHLIHVPHKAKRSNTIVFMDEELENTLKEYLIWRRRRAKTEYLLVSNKGGRIHQDAPGMIVADLGEKLHLHEPNGSLEKRLTLHCFRHWFTTHLFRAGMDPFYIQFLRGDTLRGKAWMIYNHIDLEKVRSEYLRCMPKILSGSQCQA